MRFSRSICAQTISAIAQTFTFFVTVPWTLAIPSFPTRHPVAKVYLVGGPCVPLSLSPSLHPSSFLLSSQFIRRPRFRFVFLSYLAVQRSYSSSAAAVDADP